MTAYHATHPSPYDDACPDCAGYNEPTDRSWSGLMMALAFIGLAAVVLLARILR